MPVTLRLLLAIIIVFLAMQANTARPWSSVDPLFRTAHVRIETDAQTTTLQVELATTAQQHALGLMGRAHLPPNQGMLFLFPKPQAAPSTFWMFRTLIPLDIAFLNAKGRILNIQSMMPCESPIPQRCPLYPAYVSYVAALEVNQGYFERHGISVGDRVLLLSMPEQSK